MQFANVENGLVEAKPGMAGTCPGCSGEVISKCGAQRVWHWAHVGQRDCDTWWEPETLWHRSWKLHFPKNVQEVVCRGDSGELHRADIKTQAGLVIEFQRSPIAPSEQRKREGFYGSDMAWVVDGTRLKRDLPRFVNGSRPFEQLTQGILSVFIAREPAECFPRQWLESQTLVFFDFGTAGDQSGLLWCLLPGRAEARAVVVAVSRANFIGLALTQPRIFDHREIIETITRGLRENYHRHRQVLRYFERWQARRKAARWRRF